MIWETVWPIFSLGAGATYCPYTALMWAVWPIFCQYIAHTVANRWAPKSFLGGNDYQKNNDLYTHTKKKGETKKQRIYHR